MPATSEKMRVAAAIALHHPEKLSAKNRSMLKMDREDLHDYASGPVKPKKRTKMARFYGDD